MDESGERFAVTIGIPSGDLWHASFGYALARLVGHTTRYANVAVHLCSAKGSLIPKQRQAIADEAISRGSTHIFWLDADMVFPPDTLIRLLEYGLPAVCASYTERNPPFRPTAFAAPDYLERVWPDPAATDLLPIAACGLGCFLVQTAVLTDLSWPLFAIGTNAETKSMVGEDVFFCQRLREAGVPLLLDQQLTQELRHAGTYEFRASDAVRWRADAVTPEHAAGNGKPKLVTV